MKLICMINLLKQIDCIHLSFTQKYVGYVDNKDIYRFEAFFEDFVIIDCELYWIAFHSFSMNFQTVANMSETDIASYSILTF